jgi:hypothetical protein
MIVERHFRLDLRRKRAVAHGVAELAGGDTDFRRGAACQPLGAVFCTLGIQSAGRGP